jgi:hypothetical protein
LASRACCSWFRLRPRCSMQPAQRLGPCEAQQKKRKTRAPGELRDFTGMVGVVHRTKTVFHFGRRRKLRSCLDGSCHEHDRTGDPFERMEIPMKRSDAEQEDGKVVSISIVARSSRSPALVFQ